MNPRGIFLCRAATLAAAVILGWPATAAEVAAPLDQPPTVTPIPARPTRADAVLPIEARITHPAGVGRTVLWFLGEHDTVFRPYPMRRLEGDVFTARLGMWRSRGDEVRYYLEAWDTTGTQHAALGDRNMPFVVRLERAPATTSSSIGASALWIGILSVALLGAVWCGLLVRRRLPAQAPARASAREATPHAPRLVPILVRAAGSVPAETVYLQLEEQASLAQAGLARSVAALRRLRGRKSRLAYRRRPEAD